MPRLRYPKIPLILLIPLECCTTFRTAAAIKAIGEKLKPGAPLLIYLYYAFDNRPAWYRALWRASDVARLVISHLPHPPRVAVSFTVATFIYWPLASIARATRRLGVTARSLPLSYYSDKSFYVMRTDAYDRLSTRLAAFYASRNRADDDASWF